MKIPTGQVENSQSKAFTLIELLVVIAIISLLVSILLPSLNRAKELARRIVCQSNQRQLAMTLLQYAEECDERFPPGVIGLVDIPNSITSYWGQYILPYVSNELVFQCPSDETVEIRLRRNQVDTYGTRSYVGNQAYYGGLPGEGVLGYNWGASLSEIPVPSDTFALLEYHYEWVFVHIYPPSSWSWFYIGGCNGWGIGPETMYIGAGRGTYHWPGRNFAFCDGHVEWLDDVPWSMFTREKD